MIDPLFRFRLAKEFNREEHIKAHLDYWQEAMVESSPQTIIEKEEQVDLPPILMLLKANHRNLRLKYRSASSRPIANVNPTYWSAGAMNRSHNLC